ncbi:hypothetical protein CBR_g23396 [Chara braunii]|uniref:RecA family profile 1 domain-containing protein n=1 Tax=Chara braunii TaxID=69332 RepID=A0A388L439_CHABU|nr:hypothetical protein CBR_g23396 [Chara braunii]|eukprot:GBG77070.1 hypothetical protein CBR_g23396 [Chara braunii]
MGLDDAILRRLTARDLHTARDVLCRPELDLMEIVDLPADVQSQTLMHVSRAVCPPCRTVLELVREEDEASKAGRPRSLKTRLRAVDHALLGGIPLGAITELVGPAGIGKTQFCFMLSVFAILPVEWGGLGGSVIYIDTENKFSSERLFEIAQHHIAAASPGEELSGSSDRLGGMMDHLGAKVVVVKPTSSGEVIERLQGLEEAVIERQVKLLVVDSVASLVRSEYGCENIVKRQELLGRQAAVLKYLAETFKMAVVVTNQITTRFGAVASDLRFSVSEQSTWKAEGFVRRGGMDDDDASASSKLMAALGTKWAHAVNIRIVLEAFRGRRILKIVKSPMSAVLAFPYSVTAEGIVLDGCEVFDADDGGKMSIHNENDDLYL